MICKWWRSILLSKLILKGEVKQTILESQWVLELWEIFDCYLCCWKLYWNKYQWKRALGRLRSLTFFLPVYAGTLGNMTSGMYGSTARTYSQSELPRPIPRNSVESDHGYTSKIYFDTRRWRYITWRWRHINHVNTITSVIAAKQTVINEVYVCFFPINT